MIKIDFATEANKQEIKQLVLAWLENDFQKKNQPSNHFWHNQSVIANAFDSCSGMVVRDEHQQFVAYMVWSFYSNKTGAEIDIVEVQESYRGQGIFKQMLSAFSNELPQVAVLSVSALEQAQPVFEKLGWQHAASSSSSWLRISDRVRFKHVKPAMPTTNILPNGVAIAICSEDFYQVKTHPEHYVDKVSYLTPEIAHDYSLTQPVVATCHKDGYLGFYLDQKLIHECKPKHLTDSPDTHQAVVAFAQFPSNILTAFREYAASIEASRDEQKAEEPARKMLRGKNSARINVESCTQQGGLFSVLPKKANRADGSKKNTPSTQQPRITPSTNKFA